MELRNLLRYRSHTSGRGQRTLGAPRLQGGAMRQRRAIVPLSLVILLGLVWLGLAGAVVALERLTDEPQVQRFVDDMVQQHGFARSDVNALLADAQVLSSVLDAISRPAERKPWHQYREIFLTPSRIEGGLKFWRTHHRDLIRAEREFGVSPEIIVAIIGVETRYGENTGQYRVLDALTTLAFHYPQRSRFFRSELEAFLLLSREEDFDPRSIKGSYAGAMGIPQFISSSYRAYAVDFDGDNIRDLIGNPTDAIGSVANYLSEHGWERGAGVVLPATLRTTKARELSAAGLKPHLELAEMRARGVSMDGSPTQQGRGALIELEASAGPEFWVGLQNFYTITRYNHSPLYAMAVYQLAQAIREQFGDAQDS